MQETDEDAGEQVVVFITVMPVSLRGINAGAQELGRMHRLWWIA